MGAGAAGLGQGSGFWRSSSHGAFAEQAVARAEDVVPLPDDIDDVTAAGFAIAYGTAQGALRWRADLQAGESLVVHGAGGGVGLTAVECGKAIGAMVIATARGEEKLAVARAHGADHALDSDEPDLKGRIRELTGGSGADVVYDPVGGAMFEASLRSVAWEGRIVIVGFASGIVPQIPGQPAAGQERLGAGVLLGQLPQARPRAAAGRLQGTVRLASGRAHPAPRLADPAPGPGR